MSRNEDRKGGAFDDVVQAAGEDRFEDAIAITRRILARQPGGAASAREVADVLLRVARAALGRGRHEFAHEALGLAIERCPDHADLRFLDARALVSLGRLGDARAELERALGINPNYRASRLERALLDAREGRLVAARDEIRALAEGDSLVDPVTFAHAFEALDQAEWEEAGTLFRRSLKLGDPELDERLERVRRLVDREALPAAADLLRECLRARGRYPDLHALLGTIELRQGHWDDAVSSLARALELHPDYHDARLELALAFEGLGMRSQALEQVALVLEFEPDHARALELQDRWNLHRTRAPR